MNSEYPSFQLAEFVPPTGLTGRNCGAPLKAGMTFNRLRRTRFFGDIENLQSEDVGETRLIALTLNRIEAYRTTQVELGPGMTALLEVSGDSLDSIREEIARLPDREYLTIECQ